MPAAKSREHLALGEAVRELRQAQGKSQEDLAFAAGLHRNYVGGIERGEINTSLSILIRLAAALSTTVGQLTSSAGI